MSRTITYGDLSNIIAQHYPRQAEDKFAPIVANIATNQIWNRYDWRESLTALPPFWLSPLTQDYGSPTYALPTDFLSLKLAYLNNLGSNPPSKHDLRVTKDLYLTQTTHLPNSIAFEPSTSKIRVYPRPPEGTGSPIWLVDGTYKFRPTKITPANLDGTTLPFDDMYIAVWVAVAKWAAWDLSGDQRASQQYLVQMAMVDEMARNEGVNLGDPAIAPSEPLVDGDGWGSFW